MATNLDPPKLPAQRSRNLRWATRILLAGFAIACIAWLCTYLMGMRTFVIETPSMGTAAPVGSLIVTQPVADSSDLAPGDIITFADPTSGRDYTHRIVAIDASGIISTQGDINPAPDPWRIPLDHVVGKASSIVPVLGVALRALPWMIAGGLIVAALARYSTRTTSTKAATYLLGLPLVFAIVVFTLRPFVGAVLLGTDHIDGKNMASFVSTGLLPSKISLAGTDDGARFFNGEVVSVHVSKADASGLALFQLGLDFSWLGWLALILLCLVPVIIGARVSRRAAQMATI